MNKLDLAKVGKAFGFAVPPKVNISVGSIKARKRGDDEDLEEESDENGGKRAFYRKRGRK